MSAAPAERCRQDGCNRWARATGFCIQHGKQPIRVDTGDDAAERRRLFEMQMESGNFRDLLGPTLERLIKQASEEHGIDDEAGALKYALKYVLMTETDPMRLTQALTKITAASANVARTRKLLTGATADKMTEAITTILLGLDQA